MATHPQYFLPGKSHGQKNMVGFSPWGGRESDTTEHTHNTTGQAYLKSPSRQIMILPYFQNNHYRDFSSNYFLRILNQEGAFYKYHSSLSSYLYAAAQVRVLRLLHRCSQVYLSSLFSLITPLRRSTWFLAINWVIHRLRYLQGLPGTSRHLLLLSPLSGVGSVPIL